MRANKINSVSIALEFSPAVPGRLYNKIALAGRHQSENSEVQDGSLGGDDDKYDTFSKSCRSKLSHSVLIRIVIYQPLYASIILKFFFIFA